MAHLAVFCIETRGISGVSIKPGQLFLCRYNAAGSSLIAPSLRHSPHTVIRVERSWSVSGFAASHHVHKTACRPFIICLSCLWDQSIFSLASHRALCLSNSAVCVCACVSVFGGRAVGCTQIPCRGLWKGDPAKRPSVNTFADRFASAWLAFFAFPCALYNSHIIQRLTMNISKRYFPGSYRVLLGLIEL